MPVALNSVEYGAGRPVVILHGLFDSARNWHSIAVRLSERYRVCVLDLRNHGASGWADVMDYEELAADVANFMGSHDVGNASVIGHGMGGKTAMVLALMKPERVSALAVLDIAPVTYSHDHFALVEALRELPLAKIRSRREADQALGENVPEMGVRQFLLQNLVVREGRFSWRINLDALFAGMEDLTGFPVSLSECCYDGDSLFLYGGKSDYVQAEHHGIIRKLFPDARLECVDSAGHRLHAEQPEAVTSRLMRFLGKP